VQPYGRDENSGTRAFFKEHVLLKGEYRPEVKALADQFATVEAVASDPAGIAYGPWLSVDALLAPIIGGIGTVYGPLLGALVVKSLGEATKLITGDVAGLDLVIYGSVLILVVAFAPRGIAGLMKRGSSFWPAGRRHA